MSVYKKENKFYSLLILLLSLFIIFLFIFPKFSSINERYIKNDELKNEQENVEKTLINLNDIKNNLTEEQSLEVLKYSKWFSEDEMLYYIMDFVNNQNLINPSEYIKIRSISFEKPILNELWFNETQISIDADYSSEDILLNFIDNLTDKSNAYTFFVTQLNLWENLNSFRWINLNLRYFFKE